MAEKYEPKPLENQISTASIVIRTNDTTSYTFDNLHNVDNTLIYRYGLLIWGTSSTYCDCAVIFIHTDNTVTIKSLTGNTTRTFTGSISNGKLTITANGTMWGGIRLIWLN